MLQLFKARKTSNEIVIEIHNEIDTAQDRLLQQAKAIIETTQVNNKAERLKNAGFINVDAVVQEEEKRNVLVKSTQQAELIEYYKVNYPFQKFLTESELDRICKKYNLIYAPVANYKKDVPEKNLREIESATPLKDRDAPKDKTWCEISYGGGVNLSNNDAKEAGLPFRIEGKHFQNWIQIDAYLKEEYPSIRGRGYISAGCKNYTIKRQGLFIAAPETHFILTGLKKSGVFGFMQVTVTEVKDPIVFRYCKGGIQVLSKWGLEGEDETLTNEIMN